MDWIDLAQNRDMFQALKMLVSYVTTTFLFFTRFKNTNFI
jgi:hypothetical protein